MGDDGIGLAMLAAIMERWRCEGVTLVEYVDRLLCYKRDVNPYGLPYLIASRIAESAPEIMFILLYRIRVKGDHIRAGTEEHRRVLGLLTLMLWLGKRENQRDYSRLLRNVWPCVTRLESESFWSRATVQRALLRNVMVFPFRPQKVQ